jgi:hypothetical protein
MIVTGAGIDPLATIELKVLPKFKPKTTLALKWVQASNGNWFASDRTSSSDVYETEVSTYGKESAINILLEQLELNRLSDNHVITLSNFNSGEKIFGADVNYSSTINCTILNNPERTQNTWKGFKLDLKLRALSPSFTGSPSFPSLKFLDIGYVGISRTNVNKYDTYDGTFSYLDDQSNTGIFEGTFFLTDDEMKGLRRYIATVRDGDFTITGINGVTYPFGPTRGAYPVTAKLIEWDDLGQFWNDHWKIKLKFAEVV